MWARAGGERIKQTPPQKKVFPRLFEKNNQEGAFRPRPQSLLVFLIFTSNLSINTVDASYSSASLAGRERELPLGGSQLPKRAARCAAPDAELLRDP